MGSNFKYEWRANINTSGLKVQIDFLAISTFQTIESSATLTGGDSINVERSVDEKWSGFEGAHSG